MIILKYVLVFFVAGSKWYTIYPPEGSIFVRVCNCIGSACKNRWNTPKSERNKEHWLEYANAEVNEQLILLTKPNKTC